MTIQRQTFEIALIYIIAVSITLDRSQGAVLRSSLQGETPKVSENKAARVPVSDGLLHFYVLPVGQGDAHVIQCPSGDLSIVDLGTSNEEVHGFWFTNEISAFLAGDFGRIRNVILSHNHFDHYRFLPLVLTSAQNLSSLTNIYVSCTQNEMVTSIKDWIQAIQATDKIRMFNNGLPCGPNFPPCGTIDLCPNDPDVQVKVMSANLNNCNPDTNKNIDSLVFKVIHDQVTIMFNGDFEDITSEQDENGWQKAMADFYGPELQVTVFKIAHHGAQNLANKRVSCQSHAPKAVFVSGNTWYSYRHPRCDVLDRFATEFKSLCKPLVTDSSSPDFCSEHPQDTVAPFDRLQTTYTCGENSTSVNGGIRSVADNEWAIYTTVPDEFNLNIIKFSSDGTRWGFTNNIYPKTRNNLLLDECGV